jgi:hypothetical protein
MGLEDGEREREREGGERLGRWRMALEDGEAARRGIVQHAPAPAPAPAATAIIATAATTVTSVSGGAGGAVGGAGGAGGAGGGRGRGRGGVGAGLVEDVAREFLRACSRFVCVRARARVLACKCD